jgi:hypothetical protein
MKEPAQFEHPAVADFAAEREEYHAKHVFERISAGGSSQRCGAAAAAVVEKVHAFAQFTKVHVRRELSFRNF